MLRPARALCPLAVGLAALVGCAEGPTDPGGAGAPAVELTEGKFEKVEAALAGAKGKVVLVDCWALWCGPCVANFPDLVERHKKYRDKGLLCVSVSLDSGRNPPGQVLAFLQKQKATFPNFYLLQSGQSESQKFAQMFDYKGGIPHAALFDKQGARVWAGHPMDLDTVRIELELAR